MNNKKKYSNPNENKRTGDFKNWIIFLLVVLLQAYICG